MRKQLTIMFFSLCVFINSTSVGAQTNAGGTNTQSIDVLTTDDNVDEHARASDITIFDNGQMIGILRGSKGNLDVSGRINGVEVQTTYAKNGYYAVIKTLSDNTSHALSFKTEDLVSLVPDLFSVQGAVEDFNGNYVKLKYVVTNISNEEQRFHFSIDSDTMIASNDKAPIDQLSNGKGFVMYDSSYRFTMLSKDLPGMISADTYWFGYFNSRTEYRYSQIDLPGISGIDSGLAVSWQNHSLAPGQSKEFAVLIGIGEAIGLDLLPLYKEIGDNTRLPIDILSLSGDSSKLKVLANGKQVYFGPVSDKISVDLDSTQGTIQLQGQLVNGSTVIFTSKPITIEKRNVLDGVLTALKFNRGLGQVVYLNDSNRYFENNAANKNLIQQINNISGSGVFWRGNVHPDSTVLNPLFKN